MRARAGLFGPGLLVPVGKHALGLAVGKVPLVHGLAHHAVRCTLWRMLWRIVDVARRMLHILALCCTKALAVALRHLLTPHRNALAPQRTLPYATLCKIDRA